MYFLICHFRFKMIQQIAVYLSLLFHLCTADIHRGGILFPRESETRQVVSLDGIWNFVVPNTSNPFVGFDFHWYKKDLKEVCIYFFSIFTLGSSHMFIAYIYEKNRPLWCIIDF